jgi:hypothetical protein
MARVDQLVYGSELEVAGCLTVVPAAGVEDVAGLFGHERSSDPEVSEDPGRFGPR